jgi:sialidase-1
MIRFNKDQRITLCDLETGMIPEPFIHRTDLFISEGRRHYRIPVVVADAEGNRIAYANCRMDTAADGAEEVALVFRHSCAGDDKWSHEEAIVQRQKWDAAIGSATIDSHTGQVLLSYYSSCRGRSENQPADEISGTDAGAYQWVSMNGGKNWRTGRLQVRANSTGHVGSSHGASTGITLKAGANKSRLLVPARFQSAPGETLDTLQHHHYNCALFSDDHGKTWQTSEPVQVGTGEGCLVELSDGRIYYNSRAYFLDGKRRIAWSYDGGETFTDFSIDNQLTEPMQGGCNAGLALYPSEFSAGKEIILFCNPAGDSRKRMTVRVSFDGGVTWPVSRTIYEGPSAYSSMVVGPDGTIYVLYENGIAHPYEKISLAAFKLEWILQS